MNETHDSDTTSLADHTTNNTRSIIISSRDLVKEYTVGKQKIRALNSVSLDIYTGEIVVIVGSSGSGKSTLLQILGGLDKPTSGSITIGDERLDKMSDRKLSKFRNQTVGFVFQFFYLQPFLSLARNIEIAAMPSRMNRKHRRERIVRLAEQVGLSQRLAHLPRELSGGQIQRTAIARALMNEPAIVFADEPTGNLDSENSRDIMSLFKTIRDDFGTTVVIATHDQTIAASADRVIAIQDGAIVS